MSMAKRRNRYDCDGCRRASSGCSSVCEMERPIESEEPTMTKMFVAKSNAHVVNNILYPTRPPGLWERFTGYLSKVFNF